MELLWPSLAAVVIAGIAAWTYLRAQRQTQADEVKALERQVAHLRDAVEKMMKAQDARIAELNAWCGRLSGEMDSPRNVRRGA